MKPNKLTLLPLAAAMLAVSPAVLAQDSELDMTMSIMEEGQEPAGFIQKIQLPSPAEIGVRNNENAGSIADQVREESGKLTDEGIGTVTDDVKDVLSIDGAEDLPSDIVDNLSEDLPILEDPVEDLPDLPGLPGVPDVPDLPNLPGVPELPVDLPLGESPQDVSREAADAVDTIDNTVEEGARDAGSGLEGTLEGTLEETKKLLP